MIPHCKLRVCIRYAGGTGGSGTAGLGGRAGPYRLDKGQDIHLLSEEEKNAVDSESQRRAKEMATAAYEERLKEMRMAPYEASQYEALLHAVAGEVEQLRGVLGGREARSSERTWARFQTHGAATAYVRAPDSRCLLLVGYYNIVTSYS